MKATIDATGKLSITPENELESWALRCWWHSYQKLTNDTAAILCVQDIRIDRPDGDNER